MRTNLQTGLDLGQRIGGHEPILLDDAKRAEAVQGRRDLMRALPDLIRWAEEVGGCVEYLSRLPEPVNLFGAVDLSYY